ncbi:MAG TPA: thioredoxin family protein [Caldilineaceae bacterium]|nr:thioredoxin family protein [Caldilineaceae bacterium]
MLADLLAERFLLLLAALLLTLILYWLWRVLSAYRLARRARQELPAELATLVPPGRPALLYFTAPDCAQCRLRQAPILAQLGALAQETKRELSIHTLDAIQHDSLARFFGIMTVPTTIWLDAERRPVAVNHGLATLDQLRRQLFVVRSA